MKKINVISDVVDVSSVGETEDAIVEEMKAGEFGSPTKVSFRSIFHRLIGGRIPLIEKLSFSVFLITIFLTMIGFSPFAAWFPIDVFKKGIFVFGILISFVLWLITRLEDGRLSFPGGMVFFLSSAVILATLLSSLFSASVPFSVFGLGYEQDTFFAIAIFFLTTLLSTYFFESRNRRMYFYVIFFSVITIIGVTEVAQLLYHGALLSGGMTSNLIGKWNDLGIFFGLSLVISLVALEFWSLSYVLNFFFWMLFIFSLLITATVSFNLIWLIVGLVSFLVLVYSLVFGGRIYGVSEVSSLRMHYKLSVFLLLVSIILFFSSSSLANFLTKFNISYSDVRPSWQSTVDITRGVINSSPTFGSGPNTFALDWATFKPDGVNNTNYWATDFNYGLGYVLSYAATTGILGILAWGVLVFYLLYLVFKTVFSEMEDESLRILPFSLALVVLYLWSFYIFYIPDTVLLLLTFISVGLFLSSLREVGLIKVYNMSFLGDSRLGFISTVTIVVLIVASVSGGYFVSRKYFALSSYYRSIYAFNTKGDLSEAEKDLTDAIKYDEEDVYYRLYSNIEISRLQNFLNTPSSLPAEELVAQVKNLLGQASSAATKATQINKSDYANWMALGLVGETVVPIKSIVGAYDLAVNSYNTAIALNANNPAIDLELARVEIAHGDNNKAIEHINSAIKKKKNYTDAYFLLAGLEASSGNINQAITQAEQALVFSPGNVSIEFEIGYLKYLNKDYRGAVDTLAQVISVEKDYSNAKYFLGLSYSQLGQTSLALKEFTDISNLNPDNQEVKNIISNLKAGKPALGSSVSVTSPKRSKLPVKE